MKYVLLCALISLILACSGCATTTEDGTVYVPKFKISCFGIDLHCEYVPQ